MMILGLHTYTTFQGTLRIWYVAVDGISGCRDEGSIDVFQEDMVLPTLLARYRGHPLAVLMNEDRLSYHRHIGKQHLLLKVRPPAKKIRDVRTSLRAMGFERMAPGPLFTPLTETENQPPVELLGSNFELSEEAWEA